MKKNYELNLFLNPSLTEDEINKILEKIKNYILEGKGEILEITNPDKRKLPYKMKKNREGYYVLIRFSYEPESVANLRDKVKLSEGVIRFVISVAVEIKTATKNEEREEAVEKTVAQEEKIENEENTNLNDM